MRPRTELAVAAGVVAALLLAAAAAGRHSGRGPSRDPRASSLVAGPAGVRAVADVAVRMGLDVVRWRARISGLSLHAGTDTTPAAFLVIQPSRLPNAIERDRIVGLTVDAQGGDLVLAGPAALPLMRCFGFEVRSWIVDSARVSAPRTAPQAGAAWARRRLVPADRSPDERGPLGTARRDDGDCRVATATRAETLLVVRDTLPVALRLTLPPHGRQVTLIADADLLRNYSLRRSSTAPAVLAAVFGRSRRLVFDEVHHGFAPGGSMLGATLAWSRRHAPGWVAWQLVVVGLVALLVGAVRFGPVTRAIVRERRSPLEHVRALATALAAARGQREAIDAMLRGLRRRLTGPAGAPRGGSPDLTAWLEGLARNAPTPVARARAATLAALSGGSHSSAAVLAAANAVEDLWQELRA
jgi:Domain of unknown function (DUF4350)